MIVFLFVCIIAIIAFFWFYHTPTPTINMSHSSYKPLEAIKAKTYLFIDKLYQNRDKYAEYKESIERLYKNTRYTVFTENTAKRDAQGNLYTSYTINKGAEVAICMRNKDGDLLNTNVVFYVVLHELAHIACLEEGHTALFKKIYKFLLKEAINNGLYIFHDYEMNPVNYCEYMIDENILKH